MFSSVGLVTAEMFQSKDIDVMSKMVEDLDEVRVHCVSYDPLFFISVLILNGRLKLCTCLCVCLGLWVAVQEVHGLPVDPHCHLAHGRCEC